MRRNICLGILITASLIFISAAMIASAQEPPKEGSSPEAQVAPSPAQAIPEAVSEAETQWLWGEVVTVDPQNKMLVVKTLDYETDQEKEVTVYADDKTTYENIKSMDEIKPKDNLSIDYTVSPDGKNVAKNISAEKPEEVSPSGEGMDLGGTSEGSTSETP